MDKSKTQRASEWAAPSDDDSVGWVMLTRDQQLEQLQALLTEPESNDISALSFDEVVVRARGKSRVQVNG